MFQSKVYMLQKIVSNNLFLNFIPWKRLIWRKKTAQRVSHLSLKKGTVMFLFVDYAFLK